MINKQIILKERPVGFPNETTWSLESNAIPSFFHGFMLLWLFLLFLLDKTLDLLDKSRNAWIQDSMKNNNI